MILATHVELSRSQDLHRTMKKARGRTPQSRRNQTATAVRSSRDCGSFSAESELRFSHLIRRRSTGDQDHDRRTIVARSWSDRGPFQAKIKAKLPPIRKPQHRPRNTLPRSRKTASTILSNGLKIGPNFPFKNPCIFPCSSTFHRFVKELREFRGRSLVHCDSPAFRLNCEAIGAGLITNLSLISSNFRLEFRTSTRKNPSKFASIHKN